MTLLLASAGCIDVFTPTTLFQVQGVVTSAESGAPLEGIVVEVWHSVGLFEGERLGEATTDDSGYYEIVTGIDDCRTPRLQVAWDPGDGYETATTSFDQERFDAEPSCAEDPQTVNVTLIPDGADVTPPLTG
ncbi:MAG: hypothetical protein R3253_02120 [Longimicrobiales bacterium]|nr:hypothetical protein [Longimicrobiales bacterium]